MRQSMRAMSLVVVAASAATVAEAQIPGMPLFTNPRYGSGIRIHADMGQPTDQGTSVGDLTVIQGGLTFALGPVGIGANVGALRNDVSSIQDCTAGASTTCDTQTKVTASALAQLRIAGGGTQSVSLSLFGGGSMDMNAYDALDCTGLVGTPLATCQAISEQNQAKVLTIPVGVAVGLRVPLGFATLNLWGAPRYNIIKLVNCPTGNTACDAESESDFRYAFGADLPIFRILSVRAAYEGGKIGDQEFKVWGIGASIGIGGMR